VNQRSEHLSDAQIEQYGKRASGAGPETEAWVETHLDDCPSCRNRVLEFQRTQFALLPDPKVNTVPSSNCPCEEDLRNLAAGLSAEPIANKLKTHASTCERCGPLLREYIEDFSDDVTPEEQTALAQLRSASPVWQQQKAREMLKQVRTPAPSPPSPRPIFSWKWIMTPAAAAAACALLALGIGGVTWYARRVTPEKVEKLLAQAYTEQRLLDLRFPGATNASLKQRRAGAAESLLATPLALDQAKELIRSELTKNPESQHWLLMQAQLDLLDWRYKSALTSVRKAERFGNETRDLLLTRAMVNYELSEAESQPQSYAYAVNDLGKLLEKEPDDAVALFNRALILEKLNLSSTAREDWEHFLQIEKDPAWAAEAKTHLSRLQEKKNLDP
jgi:hypothetical protein